MLVRSHCSWLEARMLLTDEHQPRPPETACESAYASSLASTPFQDEQMPVATLRTTPSLQGVLTGSCSADTQHEEHVRTLRTDG